MRLHEILAVKGNVVHAIAPDATLREVAKTLVRHNIGALLVFEGADQPPPADRILGIISERDLLHVCATDSAVLDTLRVAEVMSTGLITASPDDLVEDVMGLMTSQRKRHLPVIDKGRLLGIVSIGDVVKAQHDSLALENRFMKDYIRS
jgi:CBS domain-containing protein